MAIPVTIVGGFLGAGKTTLINQVLSQTEIPSEEILIIVNEIGEVGVDHELLIHDQEQIYQMNQGCMCCSLRGDLLQSLDNIDRMIKEGKLHVNHILIETTGIADPQPIAQTIQAGIQVGLLYYIDSVYVLLDAVNYTQSLASFPVALNQLVYADRIYLSKLDVEEADARDHIIQQVREMNPFAEFVDFQQGDTQLADSFFDQRLFQRMDDWNEEELAQIAEEADHHGHHHDHHHAEHHEDHHHDHHHNHHHNHHHLEHNIETTTLTSKVPLNERYLQSFIDWLLYTFNGHLYRYKGLLAVAEYDYLIAMQGVNTHYQMAMTTQEREGRVTRLVLIGVELDQTLIQQAFSDLVHLSDSSQRDDVELH